MRITRKRILAILKVWQRSRRTNKGILQYNKETVGWEITAYKLKQYTAIKTIKSLIKTWIIKQQSLRNQKHSKQINIKSGLNWIQLKDETAILRIIQREDAEWGKLAE